MTISDESVLLAPVGNQELGALWVGATLGQHRQHLINVMPVWKFRISGREVIESSSSIRTRV
jgi:hypothetical protein